MGLAISKNFAEMMNGDIRVTSTLNRGSTFCLEIPYFEADQKEIDSKKPKERVLHLKSGQGPVKVLIADDQEANRKFMLKILTDVGFEAEMAVDGN